MLLAGNWPLTNSSATPPAVPVQASMPRPSVLDGFAIGHATPHRSSPVPVAPISISQSAGRSGVKNDATAAKPAGVVVSSSTVAEPLKVVNPLGSVSATFLSSGTL